MTAKIALITGASRGLGRSMALHLADDGVGIVGTYRSKKHEADALVEEITSKGGKAAMLQLDVGASASFAAFKSTFTETLESMFARPDFDFLVHNAGIGNLATYEGTTEEKFDELFKVDLKGPYFLSQILLPMIARGGRILNVTTAATRFVLENHCAYAAMKSGVEVMTRYMAKELGPRGITVNAIAPGAIETDFEGGAVRDNPELNKIFAGLTPLGRAGLPEDIGSAVAGLLSSNFGWLNGERIELTGGQSL